MADTAPVEATNRSLSLMFGRLREGIAVVGRVLRWRSALQVQWRMELQHFRHVARIANGQRGGSGTFRLT